MDLGLILVNKVHNSEVVCVAIQEIDSTPPKPNISFTLDIPTFPTAQKSISNLLAFTICHPSPKALPS
ncbi:uncharacterized protein G2W53_003885 [Senna tora]|uniref:Uncharacterized protein n=1 Tax=Senna tora TaxID=362788 RepID=A0A834XBD8_9FABA|nr:uncharacterized protein G2W53_003885 [Senna tora]